MLAWGALVDPDRFRRLRDDHQSRQQVPEVMR